MKAFSEVTDVEGRGRGGGVTAGSLEKWPAWIGRKCQKVTCVAEVTAFSIS